MLGLMLIVYFFTEKFSRSASEPACRMDGIAKKITRKLIPKCTQPLKGAGLFTFTFETPPAPCQSAGPASTGKCLRSPAQCRSN